MVKVAVMVTKYVYLAFVCIRTWPFHFRSVVCFLFVHYAAACFAWKIVVHFLFLNTFAYLHSHKLFGLLQIIYYYFIWTVCTFFCCFPALFDVFFLLFLLFSLATGRRRQRYCRCTSLEFGALFRFHHGLLGAIFSFVILALLCHLFAYTARFVFH